MKTIKRLLAAVCILLLVAVATLLLGRNAIIKSLIQREVIERTGFNVTVGAVNLNPVAHSLDIRDVRLRNPADFPEEEAIAIDRLFVKVDGASLLTRHTILPAVVVDIPRMVVVKRENGESNLDRMRTNIADREDAREVPGTDSAPEPDPKPPEGSPAPQGDTPPAEPETTQPATLEPKRTFMIEELIIKVGTYETRDYARLRDGKPRVSTHELNMNRTFKNVDGIGAMVGPLMNEIVVQTGLKSVAEKLSESEDLKKLSPALEEAVRNIGDKLGELFQAK